MIREHQRHVLGGDRPQPNHSLKAQRKNLEGKEKKEEGRGERPVERERGLVSFCALFCFDLVELNLDFVETF